MARQTGFSQRGGERNERGLGGGGPSGNAPRRGFENYSLDPAFMEETIRKANEGVQINSLAKRVVPALLAYGAGGTMGLWGPQGGSAIGGTGGGSSITPTTNTFGSTSGMLGSPTSATANPFSNMFTGAAAPGGGNTVASSGSWMDIIKGGIKKGGLQTLASLYGGKMQSDSVKDASRAAAAGSQAEMDLIDKWMQIARNDTQQTRQAGSTALNAMMSMTGLAPGGQVQYDQSGWPMPVGTPQQQALSVPEPPMGRAMGGGMAPGNSYNINEMGPENVYSGGDVTRWGGPQTVQPAQGGYVQPNSTPPTAGGVNDQPGGIDTTQGTDYNWQTDPGYQFRFEEGQKALDRGAAARGGLLSGGYAQKAMRYGQGFASNEYTNVYNRIASIAGMGQTANQHAGNAALQGGFGMGAAAGAKGVNSAYGDIGSGNAWSNAMNDISSLPWDTYWGNS